ncbi:MAG: hypothetical protein A2092_16545 [Rhodobacteraceae bacterium GWE1_64_9]|nr:MAG: hypothetical protein A2092_16545 [Rhodobacteraceae bacterium GWE1_64_9]HBU14041.1 hypothetical protein [Gemmobacter sp.]
MSPLTANILCLLSMVVWAMGLPAAGFLIDAIPPLPLTALRMGIAALALLPVWWAFEGFAALRAAPLRRGLGIGVLFGAAGGLLVAAQAETDPVTVAVVSATMPVIGIGLECAFDGRRLTALVLAGVALSLVGGLIAYAEAMGGLQMGIGAVYAVSSILLYTLGSRLSVTGLPGLTPLGRSALTLTGAAVVSTAGALIAGAMGLPGPDWGALGATEALALAIYALLGMAACQLLWLAAVGHMGIGMAALHINAAPFYVMLCLVFLGQPWNWIQAFGAAIVGMGVLIAQYRPTRALQTG